MVATGKAFFLRTDWLTLTNPKYTGARGCLLFLGLPGCGWICTEFVVREYLVSSVLDTPKDRAFRVLADPSISESSSVSVDILSSEFAAKAVFMFWNGGIPSKDVSGVWVDV